MEQINLNIIPDGVMPVCHASQFDKNRTIRFNLNRNGSVYTLAGTETITCKVRKPDDTESTINVANTSSSYVDVTFGFSDTDLSGYAMCELKIVKGAQTIGSRNFLLRIEADAYDGSVFEERSASGAIASFETNFIDNLTECIVDIDAVQAGSGTPSPSNPRAISGHSELNLVRCGKNWFDGVIEEGTIDAHGNNQPQAGRYRSKNYIQVVPNSTYQFSKNGTAQQINYFKYDANKNFISSTSGTNITTDANTFYVRFYYNSDINVDTGLQLELGSTATAYTPYNGQTYNIPFGQTVYGGSLNVTTGELTITHHLVDLGTLNWSASNYRGWAQTDLSPWAKPCDNNQVANIMCSQFNPDTANRVYSSVNNSCAINDNRTLQLVADASLANLSGADFKAAMSGIQLAYERNSPTTVQLTPTEVRTLLNDNNIFADTGDIEVKYLIEVV